MIADSLTNIEFYKAINEDIYQGLVFIKNADPEIELGVYPITDNAKAVVMEYDTKIKNDFGYEAHKHVIDVQYCIKNSERIPYSNVKRLSPNTEYDTEKDFTFFDMIKPQGEVIIGNDIFAIFYPEDGHAPVYSDGEPGYIKKIVIKVKV
ncbi:YhcH/YjgK/YiaL family protein [Mucilaginibacter segetis]|uniref:YhcH/YjgK/YiaL family protein n=1 Tax=Mucilaginibacter segetis TaxID=2793071 RepID=A0A934PWA5_9SPHI|nr:YhcH/YjgK/YiaL family protein [Mucilaginibacter segetis]MBK0380686.1 YhcH/YjgK/YiaL family protein [Mucilaginibacter segetis]